MKSTHAEPLKIGQGGNELAVSSSEMMGRNEEGRLRVPTHCISNQYTNLPGRHEKESACAGAMYVTDDLIIQFASRLKLAEQKINEMEALYSKRIEKLLKDIEILTNSLDSLNKRIDKN